MGLLMHVNNINITIFIFIIVFGSCQYLSLSINTLPSLISILLNNIGHWIFIITLLRQPLVCRYVITLSVRGQRCHSLSFHHFLTSISLILFLLVIDVITIDFISSFLITAITNNIITPLSLLRHCTLSISFLHFIIFHFFPLHSLLMRGAITSH